MVFEPEDMGELLFGKGKRKTRLKIPRHIKHLVWNMHIGSDKAEGKCYACGKPIHIQNFEVGHNVAKSKGGSDHPENLRPICRGCNLAMGTMSIEAFKRKYFSKPTKKKPTKRKRPKTPLERLAKQLEKDF